MRLLQIPSDQIASLAGKRSSCLTEADLCVGYGVERLPLQGVGFLPRVGVGASGDRGHVQAWESRLRGGA